MEDQLPEIIKQQMPKGLNAGHGTWLVLPSRDVGDRDGINTTNKWLREQEWYPEALQAIIWFGDDGVGNLLGWDKSSESAVLWNPADGSECWHKDSVESVWQFIKNDYE